MAPRLFSFGKKFKWISPVDPIYWRFCENNFIVDDTFNTRKNYNTIKNESTSKTEKIQNLEEEDESFNSSYKNICGSYLLVVLVSLSHIAYCVLYIIAQFAAVGRTTEVT